MSAAQGLRAYAYIDGAYLRSEGSKRATPFPNPKMIVNWAMQHVHSIGSVILRRTSYYDAEPPDGASSPAIDQYWEFVEKQFDTDLRFGEVRGKPRRQKGVDVLLAVDMLSASSRQLVDVVILVAGDADFAPLIREVRRYGVTVLVAGVESTTARELQDAADRFVALDSVGCSAWGQEPFQPVQ
jgi:uncharacterized LabA/DUF88 family protein